MKKTYIFLLLLSFAAITNLRAQLPSNTLCDSAFGLKGAFIGDTTPVWVSVSWKGPAGNYRIFYAPTLGSQPYSQDVTNATSTILYRADSNNLLACQSLYFWVKRLDCPNTGNVGKPSDTILVSTVVPKFMLIKDTTTAYHWFILDSSYGRSSLSYLWSWGDGATSTIGAASHTYASAGFYNICLTVTDIYGCSNTLCDSSFNIYRMENGNPITVDVVESIATAIPPVAISSSQMSIKQNPCAECEISGIANANDIIVSDMLGRIVQTKFVKTGNGYQLQFANCNENIFLIKNIRTGQVIKVMKD